uniref:Uncharacterized protein n=1 Tax=viral metagenome TaxID=1070528 RepID=A0A6M3KY03_9ZZZZ
MDEQTKQEIERLLMEQVEINRRNQMDSLCDILHIDKSDEWIQEQYDSITKFMSDNTEAFSTVASTYVLADAQDPKFILVIKFNGLEDTLARLTKFFLIMGYLKGRVEQEKLDKIESIWKED